MKNLIATSALALVALQAGADPRLGTKACVVENARWFDPRSGEHGIWSDAQKSFVLNVYTCEDVEKRNLQLDKFQEIFGSPCSTASENLFAITTSINDSQRDWGDALARSPVFENGEVNSAETTPIVAEFHSEANNLSRPNRSIFRLYPDVSFEFLKIGHSASHKTILIWTLTGSCADFQQ